MLLMRIMKSVRLVQLKEKCRRKSIISLVSQIVSQVGKMRNNADIPNILED